MKRRGKNSHISGLRQQGCLKAVFPKSKSAALDAVFLNTSGGLTGGDNVSLGIGVGDNAAVTVTSQAAERAYRSLPGQQARMNVDIQVKNEGKLAWLPQETIIFDGANLHRSLTLDLEPTSQALVVEPVVFGRTAMGEAVCAAAFSDSWRVRRGGSLVYADATRINGNVAGQLANTAVAGGAIAMAAVLYVGRDAAAKLSVIKPALPETAGAGLVEDGVLFLRLLAQDGYELRRGLIPLVEVLHAAPMPRVWRL